MTAASFHPAEPLRVAAGAPIYTGVRPPTAVRTDTTDAENAITEVLGSCSRGLRNEMAEDEPLELPVGEMLRRIRERSRFITAAALALDGENGEAPAPHCGPWDLVLDHLDDARHAALDTVDSTRALVVSLAEAARATSTALQRQTLGPVIGRLVSTVTSR